MSTADGIDAADLKIVRDLAKRLVEVAASDENQERKRLWYKHAAFEGERPMILAESLGPAKMELKCKGERARGFEGAIRSMLSRFEVLRDDHVLIASADYNWAVSASNFGVETEMEYHYNEDGAGSRRWDAPIKDLDKDFDLLKHRTFSVDREATLRRKDELEAVYGGILPIRRRGGYWWTMGMTWPAIELIGLEGLMLAMVDNPDGLHRLMRFLCDDHLAHAQRCEDEGLLSLNNENDYIGSGSEGYTHELPQPDWKEGDPVRTKDLWVLSESQETVGVGPAMFEEFIFPYQLEVIEKFGLCYYGCCEPVHSRWHILQRIPNLRRVSVSPWCDQAKIAEQCGNQVVFSRKPNPTLISTPNFDEDAIRADIRETLELAKGCTIEFAMKDVHTLCGENWRMPRWVEIVREEIDKAGY